MKNMMKKYGKNWVCWLIWIGIWQLADLFIHNNIIFAGPFDMALTLAGLLKDGDFWLSLFHSSLRICLGFLSAFCLGILLGSLGWAFPLVKEFLKPPMLMIRSVPVASFVILALIWIGSKNLAVLISFVIVFPVIYRNTLQGMKAADEQLLEMADVFGMSAWSRLWYVYRPALLPYLLAGSRIACGMAWKSGVAAEVIGVPELSIGEKLYMAKIYLSTAELFAWTFVVIVVSRLLERAFLWLLGQLSAKRMGDRRERTANRTKRLEGMAAADRKRWAASSVKVRSLSKAYREKTVLSDLSFSLEAGQIYCLMGTSGIGKTTLLRILMGLETPDKGSAVPEIRPESAISAVFQENRLLGYADALDNIRIAGGRRGLCCTPQEVLQNLIEPEAWQKRTELLSGGMQRRVALARALAVRSGLILMDEPFTGLDEETKKRTIQQILQFRAGRTLLVVTHQEEDVQLLGARVLRVKWHTNKSETESETLVIR